jgi:serine/threonine protein kinase
MFTAIDLLSKMLVFNPQNRISIEEALEHPYLKALHNPKEEPVCPKNFDFEFEKSAGTKLGIQKLIFEEIEKLRPGVINPVS